MDAVIAARAQMGTSLAFHIVFAALGVGLPLLVFVAEGMWLRTRDRAYYEVARTWAKGMAILFAVGAVSGTILSFEIGLLFPTFMRYAGGIIGLPFGLEGFAFFIEAIFVGLYLYGWERLSPRAHWLAALPMVIAGPVSAAMITLVNAWMQMPTGFRIVDGRVVDVQPLVAMFALPWKTEVAHGTLAAYVFTGFATAGICALAWLRGKRTPAVLAGLRVAMIVATISAPAQLILGDVVARFDADHEPAKFAAMETLERTQRGAPLSIGGIPTAGGGIAHAIEIPKVLSLLVAFDPNAEITGLDRIPPDDRPPVAATHLSFDAMVGTGSLLVLVAVAWLVTALRRRPLAPPLAALIALGPLLAFVALEAGWFVTEFGRQPWIAHGLLRTADATTTAPYLGLRFGAFSGMYVVLAAMCWWLLIRVGASHDASAHPPIGTGASTASTATAAT
jgi:cytochrome d ubiquinol oxidase subunit I